MSVENSNYGLDRGRIMAIYRKENLTADGRISTAWTKTKRGETPIYKPDVDKGLADDNEYIKSLQDQIADLQERLKNGGGNSGTPKTPAYQPTAIPSYSPNADRGILDAALASKPQDFDYDQYGRILGMMQEYQGREPFSYDLNADMLYQQYKNQYMRNGQRAMQDTVGQVSALNGGYASSYAQTAGQQAYNNELGKLNDVIPELYQLAYSQYAREGDEMLKGIELANDAYKTRYDEYRDSMTDWRNDVARAQSMYEDQRDFDYNLYRDQRNFDYEVYADDLARKQKQQQLDLDNYQTALSYAQQNAGNKSSLDATMSELVRMGVIDESTAQRLSGTYANITPTAEAVKTSLGDYAKVTDMIQEKYLTSAKALQDFLSDTAVKNGWIDDDTAYAIFKEYYPLTPEGEEEEWAKLSPYERERRMAEKGISAAYRYIK